MTFEVLTPKQTCEAFGRGLSRKVEYRRGPIEFHVPVPEGYREHLEIMQEVLGQNRAGYFGPEMYYPHEAITLWEGNRGIEEYAHEIFPGEEEANGLTWMMDDESNGGTENETTENEPIEGSGSAAEREERRAEVELGFTESAGL